MVADWPCPPVNARNVRENADKAAGSFSRARMLSASGRSRPSFVERPSDFAATLPTNCTARSTPGTRNNANASLPIGNDASHSAGLTFFVTLPTNTRRSTKCGY